MNIPHNNFIIRAIKTPARIRPAPRAEAQEAEEEGELDKDTLHSYLVISCVGHGSKIKLRDYPLPLCPPPRPHPGTTRPATSRRPPTRDSSGFPSRSSP